MANRELLVKGYKIDRDKLKKNFASREDDPDYIRFLPLWKNFPERFLYMTSAIELGDLSSIEVGDEICLVVVLADGYDKEALEKVDVVELAEPYTKVFTPGIWIKY
jgi:hypothetical protein